LDYLMGSFLFGFVVGANLAWVFTSLRRDSYWREFNARRRGSNPPPPGRKPAPPVGPPIKPQPAGGRMIDQSGMTIGYQPLPRSGRTTTPPPHTMSNPYRTMIARLAAALQQQVFRDPEMDGNDLPCQARALLAQPEPAELTEQELWQIWDDIDSTIPDILRAAIAADRARRPTPQPLPEGLTDGELDGMERRYWKLGSSIEIEPEGISEVWDRKETFDHRAFARAAISAACARALPTPEAQP
jgi:hypothetical protein